MLAERAPAILTADHHQRRTSDAREMESRIGPVEKRLDLAAMLLGRRAHHHLLQWAEQLAIVLPVGMNHRRQPAVRQCRHAFRECQVYENLTAHLFPLAPRTDAGID